MWMSAEEQIWSTEKAMRLASRGEAFKATTHAMNTWLVHKGICTPDKFQKVLLNG
jgi:hypothetical protein